MVRHTNYCEIKIILCLCPFRIAKCGNPEMLFMNDTVPRVEGYNESDTESTLEGSTVSLSCPLGSVLTGSGSVTCTANGEWEPDPKGIMCNNMSSEG